MSHMLIAGVPVSSPPPAVAPARKEIVDFVAADNIKEFSLYVQAVNFIMYSQKESELTSWFQLGGIHGDPLVAWNGVTKDDWFCVHGTPHFPTWHRPYVAVLEQSIQAKALEIAKTYTVDNSAWIAAAQNLRQPYWDWASNDPHLPPPVVINQSLREIEIQAAPQAKPTPFPNPWIFYKFQSTNHPGTGSQTSRSNLSGITTSYLRAKNLNTSKIMEVTDWTVFATTGVNSIFSSRRVDSLESMHNSIHNNIGGYMSDPSCAAFDPIFWLHHSQVDRLLELWLSRNRGAEPPNPSTTRLRPFWQTQTAFWASGGANLEAKNYNYSYVNAARRVAGEPRQVDTEWNIDVKCNQYDVGQSFGVHFFLGPIPEDPETWYSSPDYVGAFDAFVNKTPEACQNCRNNAEAGITGVIDITDELAAKNVDVNDREGGVVEYLKNNLKWVTKKVEDNAIVELPSLKITIVHTPLLGFPRGEPDERIGQSPFTPYPIAGELVEHTL